MGDGTNTLEQSKHQKGNAEVFRLHSSIQSTQSTSKGKLRIGLEGKFYEIIEAFIIAGR
jgi:hypothetical protein